MPRLIHQKIMLPASPKALFKLYLDSKQHGAAIDDKVAVSRKAGSRFTAFGGMLRGKILMVVPDRMIVQSWRASSWKKYDADSILILLFGKAAGGGRIELIQANVPDHAYAHITKGWPEHYWKPWKTYLSKRRSR